MWMSFGASIVLALLVRYKTYESRPPRPLVLIIYVQGFFMSLVWIWFSANILIDLLQIFGILTNLPSSLLAMTILTWGNSSCDLLANYAVAKNGYGEMAMTGCYASPLFNTLLGIGISSIKINLARGTHWIPFTIDH